MTKGKIILIAGITTVCLMILSTFNVCFAREKYDFIEPENTSIKVILFPSRDTISATDTLLVKVMILNTGGRNLFLADVWEDNSKNLAFSFTDKKGKDVKLLESKNAPTCGLIARNPWASSLILGLNQFWGFTLKIFGDAFPKPGVYYFQVTYKGTSPEFIKELIDNRFIERSKVVAPLNKYWHGEAMSNKVTIVVKSDTKR